MLRAIKKNVFKILPWLIIGTTAYFFTTVLASNWDRVEGLDLTIGPLVIAAIILFALAVPVSGILWGGILSTLAGKEVKTRDAVRIHCASWLLKYMPGQAGSILNKLAWGKKNGYDKKLITTSFIYENVLMVVAGLLLSVPVLALLFGQELANNLSLFIPVLLIVPMLIVFERSLFYRLINILLKLVGKEPIKGNYFLSRKKLYKYLMSFMLPRALNGIGFVLIAVALVGAPASSFIGLGTGYVLAGIIGLLAIFVPSGLGVREAVIVLFASQYFSLEEAIFLSVIARLYATIADIGVFGIYLFLNNWRIKQR